jgi:hypothetical protein
MKITTLIKSGWILLFWGITGIACEEPCGSGASSYKVTDYDLITVKAGVEPLHNERSFAPNHVSLLADNENVDFEDVGFVAEPTTRKIAKKSGPSFFPSAFACAPATSQPTQKIASIEIISSSDFITGGQTIAAGGDLTPFFGIGYPDATPISDYLSMSTPATTQWILFVLTSAPTGQQQHEFKFTITLDDGSEFSGFSKLINIIP